MNAVLLPRPVRLDRNRRPLGVHRHPVWKPGATYTFEDATFTVPGDVSEERVQFSADRYRSKFGKHLELQGYQVLEMKGPFRDGSLVAIGITDPDRRPYRICAKVTRRPIEFTVDVPDEDIGLYEKAGYKHK